MGIFDGWNRQNWKDVPWYHRALRDLMVKVMLQNEVILAKLEEKPLTFSPEDQVVLDEIYKEIKGVSKKEEDALKK